MARLVAVDREKVKAAQKELEELEANDPHLKKEREEMERRFAKEKKRRDAEHAAKQAEKRTEGE